MHQKVCSLIAVLALCCACMACSSSPSPQTTLKKLAIAITKKDVSQFRQLVNVESICLLPFVEQYGQTGTLIPPRNLEYAIEAVEEGIASGTLAHEAERATQPGNPWYPAGLTKADIQQPFPGIALIGVDNAQNIRTWLIAYEEDGGWKIDALASHLQKAQHYASPEFRQAAANYGAAYASYEREQAARLEAYKQAVELAQQKALNLLAGVEIGNFTFEVEQRQTGQYLTIRAEATNTLEALVRLWEVEMTTRASDGTEISVNRYKANSVAVAPGQTIPLSFRTHLRSEEERQWAAQLVQGAYDVSGATYEMALEGQRIDGNGGSLRPSLPASAAF